jgi:hypothetical protein
MSSVEIEMTAVCCICLEADDFKYDVLRCCGKQMHRECYIDWILHKGTQATCPMCRHSIDINKIPINFFKKHVANKYYLTAEQQRNLQHIQSEYENESINYFLIYLAVIFGIGIFLAVIISLV